MPVAGVGPHLSSSVKDAVRVSTFTAFFFARVPLPTAVTVEHTAVDVTSETPPGIIARSNL